MTLITRLSTAFTDTTLPKLRKDPVLADAGSLILYDFKASANRADGFSLTSPEFVNLGSYTSKTSITVPTGIDYDETKGALVYESGTNVINVETGASAGSSNLFNTTDNFLLILWASRRATNVGTFFYFNYLAKGTGSTGSGDQTLYFMNNGTTPNNSIIARVNFDATSSHATDSAFMSGPTSGGAPVQLAMHWFKTGSTWEMNAYSNKTKATNEPTSTDPLWLAGTNLAFFRQTGGYDGAGAQVHRLVVENLTQSGRSVTEVLNLDYAYSNGRFSS